MLLNSLEAHCLRFSYFPKLIDKLLNEMTNQGDLIMIIMFFVAFDD